MRWSHNLGLQGIVSGLSDRVLRAGQRLVAIGSTVVSVFGEKIEGAERGYNPHKPGRDSYPPFGGGCGHARSGGRLFAPGVLRQQPWV
jgi:hypothetical protein